MAPRIKAAANKRNTADAILEAAERLCATHGIEAMSIRDVAAEVGVSIPVIYHHYGSRSNLLRMVALNRFSEIGREYQELLTALEAQESPAVRDIIRAVLQPVNQWRKPGREASLQFYAQALVCPLPEVKETLDVGVAGFYRVVELLQRTLPHLTSRGYLLEAVLHHQALAHECMGCHWAVCAVKGRLQWIRFGRGAGT